MTTCYRCGVALPVDGLMPHLHTVHYAKAVGRIELAARVTSALAQVTDDSPDVLALVAHAAVDEWQRGAS